MNDYNKSILFKLIFFLLIFLMIFLISNYIKIKIFKYSNNKNDSKSLINNLDDSKIKSGFVFKQDDIALNLNKKKSINISLSLDNSHVYQTLVVMTSALENNDKNNHILIFYLLLSSDFNNENLKIIESLKIKFETIINYYYIPNIFNSLVKWKGSNAIYYKLFIPLLFPYLKRMIHLDGDTLVFKDLYEMFNLPLGDNYFLAQPSVKHIFKDRIFKKNVINVGVILFNIELFRKDNKDFEVFYYLFKNKFTEQDVLNYVCLPNVGYLPFKYGIFFIGNINTYIKNMENKMTEKVNITEVSEAINDPSIVHVLFCYPKHWIKETRTAYERSLFCKKYQELFYYYANKTNYYEIIYNKYMK